MICKVPSISSIATLAINDHTLKITPSEAIYSICGATLYALRYRSIANRIRAAGLVSPLPARDMFFTQGDLNIAYNTALFGPESETFGPTYRWVGASFEKRPGGGSVAKSGSILKQTAGAGKLET